uniref:Thermopsin n=1 Tax=Acidianus brierleyi TaxID=41673 RepID=A0A2U9IDJ0_9CREN
MLSAMYNITTLHTISISEINDYTKKISNITNISSPELVFWNTSYPKISPIPFNNTNVNISSIRFIINKNFTYSNNTIYKGYPFYIEKIYSISNKIVKGNWTETPYTIFNINYSDFYYNYKSDNMSFNIKSNYILIKSNLSYQFLIWNISKLLNNFTINLIGRFSQDNLAPSILLGYNINNKTSLVFYNYSSILVNLGKDNFVFSDTQKGIGYIGKDAQFNPQNEFNVSIEFYNNNNSLEITKEIINDTEYNIDLDTHFNWNDIKEIGIVLPLGTYLDLYNMSIDIYNPVYINKTYINWDTIIHPSTLVFTPIEPLTGNITVNSSVPLNIYVQLPDGKIEKYVSGPITFSKLFLKEENQLNVTINSIYVKNDFKTFIIIGKEIYTINKYSYNESYILGGIKIIFNSNSAIKILIYDFPYTIIELNGKETHNNTLILYPGDNTLYIIYSDQSIIPYSIFLSIMSYIVLSIAITIYKFKNYFLANKIFKLTKKS